MQYLLIKIIGRAQRLVKKLPVAVGAIKIGNFEEEFNMCLK